MKQMSAWDADHRGCFLQTMHFRYRTTKNVYACILGNFQRFGQARTPESPPSVSLVQQWLRERSQQWPEHMVYHRARLIDRFLEWLHRCGIIPTNPMADLRRQYGKGTATIVRALIAVDHEAALQRLHPLPRFGSSLGELMGQHVAQMRSLGYRYDVTERLLLRRRRFVHSVCTPWWCWPTVLDCGTGRSLR
jgi:integrase/recombinase XerD